MHHEALPSSAPDQEVTETSPSDSVSNTPRTKRRLRIATALAAVLLSVLAPYAYAQMRIGIVDITRAMGDTAQGQQARGQLRELFRQRQQVLDARQRELSRLRDEIERQRNTMERTELARRMEDYQQRFVQFQQDYVQFQQEIAQREAEMTKQILSNLQGVIRRMGSEESYTAIFEQQGIVYSPNNMDLTERVVRSYNQMYPASAATAASADGGVADAGARADAGPRTPLSNPHPRGENAPPTQ